MEEDRRRIELRRFQMAIARCEVDFTGTYSLTVAGGVRWPAGRTLDMSAHDVGEVRRHVQHDENRDIVEMRRQSAEEEAQRLRPAGRCADGENARDGNRRAHLDRRRPGRVRPGIP
jgi:hypothetical protein